MRLWCRLPILTLILCAIASGFHPADAVRLSCSDSQVEFESDGTGDFGCVCETTQDALTFLKSIGLETSRRVVVRLVEHIPSRQNHIILGAYNPNSQEVTLVTYPKALELAKKSPMFGIELSQELWCSYAAHELAHVVSSQHINPKIKTHTAGEYISAVTQFTVLPSKMRQLILKKYQDIPAYKYREEMSELYFLLDPIKFTVKSYLHFINQKNPKKFIDKLIKEG